MKELEGGIVIDEMTEEDFKISAEIVDRRNILIKNMIEYKKKQIAKITNLIKEKDNSVKKARKASKVKRKSDKKARRNNRGKK